MLVCPPGGCAKAGTRNPRWPGAASVAAQTATATAAWDTMVLICIFDPSRLVAFLLRRCHAMMDAALREQRPQRRRLDRFVEHLNVVCVGLLAHACITVGGNQDR